MNKIEVHKGDVLFIESGTLHAIGAGLVIAEIQQNSKITCRLYDCGRIDRNGRARDSASIRKKRFLLLYKRGARIAPGMPKGFYDGYSEVFVYEMD